MGSRTQISTKGAGTGARGWAAEGSGGRTALRIAGTAIVAAMVVGLSPSSALAAPRNPSDAQLSAAQQAKVDAAVQVQAIRDELAQARAGVEAARQAALVALQDYEDKQAAYEAARAAADAAAAAAAKAAADLQGGRDEVVSFARDSFMRGSTDPGMTALLSSGGPAELIERSALLHAAGVHRTEVVAQLTVLEVKATVADQVAQQTAQETAAVRAHAAELLAGAQSQEIAARSQADALDVREDVLQAQLQAAHAVLDGLEGDRAAAEAVAAQQAAAAAAASRAAQRTAPAPAPAPAPSRPEPSRPEPSRPAPVSPPPGGSAGAPSVSAAQAAIAAARSQIGVAYSWGGGGTNGPSYGISPDGDIFGFDCSGLTQYAYARAGISIGGTSRDQWWLNRTKQVAAGDLQPGDLLFWGSDRSNYMSITHVAIYIGNGQMIEAPDRGQQVMLSTARTSSSTYFGAVRPSA